LVQLCAGELLAIAYLPNDQAAMAAQAVIQFDKGEKYQPFIKQTIKDFLGRRGILHNRKVVPGLQLPTFETLELAYGSGYAWSHIKHLHSCYNGPWQTFFSNFLHHFARHVCNNGHIWIFGRVPKPCKYPMCMISFHLSN
jgi:hypothetical protein